MRHGQAENNTKRVLAGRTEGVKLTELGIQQAKQAAPMISQMKIGAVYCSPIERAHITAELASADIGPTPQVDERLIELEMGKFTGVAFNEISSRYGNVFLKFYKEDPEITENGVEPFSDVRKRVRAIVNDVIKRHPDENVLLVTHMDPIKAMLADTMDLSAELLTKMVIANASMTVFGRGENSLYMRAVNVVDASRYSDDW